ncbi:MAG: hypothetical protein ACOX2K_09015 [Bacillota bacterium]
MDDRSATPRTELYILLTNTYSLITRAIGLYTGEPYNHVSIGFDRNLSELFSFGRLQPRNPWIGGFVQEDVESGTFAYFKDTRCALYRMQVTPGQWQAVRDAVREFELQKEKYSFNAIGFAGVAAGYPIDRRYAYFCSQFVSTVLDRGGVRLFSKPCGLVTPADFQRCQRLTRVYEGKLSEYRRSLSREDAVPAGIVSTDQ